jgi:ABC-type lipoprotein export system ATPase subunit
VPLLRLEAVTMSYRRGPDDVAVLRDASLEIEAGSLVSVYGERNAGKTTLLRIAGGFQRPSSGRVLFAGADLAALRKRSLARLHSREIGWIDRRGPSSATLDVITHVALPLYGRLGHRDTHRRALRALAALDLAGYADQRWIDLPDRARILCAVARAKVHRPRLLIADDPTSGLGIIDREWVCGVLRATAEQDGVGILMAVPDMPSMLQAHEVRLLTRGRLVGPDQPSRFAYQS